MKKSTFKKTLISLLSLVLLFSSVIALPAFAEEAKEEPTGVLSHLNSYSTGYSNQSGGVAEIIAYNNALQKAYLVNGEYSTVDVLKYSEKDSNFILDRRIKLDDMIEGFSFGDVTSVSVDANTNNVAVAVQHEDYSANGAILILNEFGKYVTHYEAGVQPDMVLVSEDGNYILSANEGEPREGYGAPEVDPMGSVTVVDLTTEEAVVTTVTFEAWDKQRDDLVAANILLKKDLNPSTDFEPEYITLNNDNTVAYVSLQEANAIAKLDLETLRFETIYSLGFKDHRLPNNEIDVVRDKEFKLENQNIFGVLMPDAIDYFEIGGQEYLFTANEGDASEWGEGSREYNNMKEIEVSGEVVEVLNTDMMDGFPLEDGMEFILGGRSFSIFRIDEGKLTRVFDSGKDFEEITGNAIPEFFNASNKNNKLDGRSDAKGPEPEDVKVATLGDKVYAYIGLERIGGVMLYDVTEPAKSVFVGYINSRDFSIDFPEEGCLPEQGDISPEGLFIVAKENSPTGNQLILVACEVSGTVAIYEQAE